MSLHGPKDPQQSNQYGGVYVLPNGREIVASRSSAIEPALGKFFDDVLTGAVLPSREKLRQACAYVLSDPARRDPGGMIEHRGRFVEVGRQSDLDALMFFRLGVSAYDPTRVISLVTWEGLYRPPQQTPLNMRTLSAIDPLSRRDEPIVRESGRIGPAILVAPREQLLIDADVLERGTLVSFAYIDRSQALCFATGMPRLGRRDVVWSCILEEQSTAERIHAFSRNFGGAGTICSYIEHPHVIPFFPVRVLRSQERVLAHPGASHRGVEHIWARMHTSQNGQRFISLTNRGETTVIAHLLGKPRL